MSIENSQTFEFILWAWSQNTEKCLRCLENFKIIGEFGKLLGACKRPLGFPLAVYRLGNLAFTLFCSAYIRWMAAGQPLPNIKIIQSRYQLALLGRGLNG